MYNIPTHSLARKLVWRNFMFFQKKKKKQLCIRKNRKHANKILIEKQDVLQAVYINSISLHIQLSSQKAPDSSKAHIKKKYNSSIRKKNENQPQTR